MEDQTSNQTKDQIKRSNSQIRKFLNPSNQINNKKSQYNLDNGISDKFTLKTQNREPIDNFIDRLIKSQETEAFNV